MKKYYTEKHLNLRPVTANSAGEAAQIFADRLARRHWGQTGYAREPRLDHRTKYSMSFAAQLCKKNKYGEIVFVNQNFSVYWEE
jgi:hypothetical protein